MQFTRWAVTMSQNLLSLLKVGKYVRSGMAVLAPQTCLLCGAEGERTICSGCNQQFFSIAPHRCRSCALPLRAGEIVCGQCLSDPPAFQGTTVACDYQAPLDQLVLALKFGHELALAPTLAQLLAKSVVNSVPSNLPDYLIPVPLSRSRLAERGFNQALEIARPLARQLNLPVYPRLLQRVRDTTAQTLLHPNQRRKNIRHAFSLNDSYTDKIPGKHVGVVDDVMTTGATLDEIAACLKRHGASRVSNFVFARTPPH